MLSSASCCALPPCSLSTSHRGQGLSPSRSTLFSRKLSNCEHSLPSPRVLGRGLESLKTQMFDSSLRFHFNKWKAPALFSSSQGIPEEQLSKAGAVTVLSVWNYDPILPHDFLGELVLPLNELREMGPGQSIDDLPAAMWRLCRPDEPSDGPFLVSRVEYSSDFCEKDLPGEFWRNPSN